MTQKNNQITLTSRIITLALVVFAATNGIFSAKLNAKAANTNSNNSTSRDNNKKVNYATLVSASVKTVHESKAGKSRSHQALHNAAKNIKSKVLLNYARKASNTVNRIESSSIASNVHKRATIRSSFTSTGNYYRPVSDVTSASSSDQPESENRGNSLGLNKTAIQNRYPAEFQSLNNVYQNASMKTSLDVSKANNANQYLSACESLNNRNQQETFNWHFESNSISPETYQSNLNSQYQQLSSKASYIYNVKLGLSNTSYIAKQLNQTKYTTYQNSLSIKANDDANSLTAINQSLASNNDALKSVNHDLEFDRSEIHNIHVSKHLMNLNNQSVKFQSTSNQRFIDQVSKRCVQHSQKKRININHVFKNVINNITKDYKLKGLNNYNLFNQLKNNDVIIYTNHNGNLVNVTPGHKISQKYTYAFPLYNRDYLNFINTVNNIAIKMNYTSLNSTNVTKLNQIKQQISSLSSQLNPLKSKNQILTKEENAILNQWKLDSFLLSEPEHQSKLNQFYKKYLDNIINVDNQIYYGTLGINVYLFNPDVNSYGLLAKKNGHTGINLKLSNNDLNQINQVINKIYAINKGKSINKYKAMFQANNVILPHSIFQFLRLHNYRLANGQSVLRNIILCSVKCQKDSGNLNLFIKFQRCNRLNELNQLSDHNDIHEMIPILHNYYPLRNQEVTDATKSILNSKTNNQQSLQNQLNSASSSVDVMINKYQASLSNFINYSGLNKELASAKYFASSYASDVKSDQSNVSLANIALDTFYIGHSVHNDLNNNSKNHSSISHLSWQHIPQYIYVNSGTPIYGANYNINHVITNSTLHVIGIGTNHNGRVFYKVSHHHQTNYIPADSQFITNAYYPVQNNVLVRILQPTQAYYDAKLTAPYKKIPANTRIKGDINSTNINSEKTIFKSKNGNYLPADTQHLKLLK